jgi:hypothetical protein
VPSFILQQGSILTIHGSDPLFIMKCLLDKQRLP